MFPVSAELRRHAVGGLEKAARGGDAPRIGDRAIVSTPPMRAIVCAAC
ncbi:MAG TPA: hypothetical protein VEI03_14335 [Stellaceae bacterium]|nr:hypothetical protein [Stellaceae bacterium]